MKKEQKILENLKADQQFMKDIRYYFKEEKTVLVANT